MKDNVNHIYYLRIIQKIIWIKLVIMTNSILKMISFFILAITIFSCHKEHTTTDQAPIINITTPEDGSVLSGEIHIAGTISDESLHELHIKVVTELDNKILFSTDPEVHDKSNYTINEHFNPRIAAESKVALTVTVEDHQDHVVNKMIKFTIKP